MVMLPMHDQARSRELHHHHHVLSSYETGQDQKRWYGKHRWLRWGDDGEEALSSVGPHLRLRLVVHLHVVNSCTALTVGGLRWPMLLVRVPALSGRRRTAADRPLGPFPLPA
jgi:hypothetical protein